MTVTDQRMNIALFRNLSVTGLILFFGGLFPLAAKLTPEQIQSLPSAATHAIQFREEIQPILETSCLKCHARGKSKGGFSLETRDALLKGGDTGSSIVSGNSADSLLIELVAGLDPTSVMPKKGSKLTEKQIGLLRAWIDQGAKWDADINFAKQPPRNLNPRTVALPTARGSEHPIDRLMQGYFEKQNISPPSSVDDRTFARRAYLDVTGLLASPEAMEAILEESGPKKREKLVQRLLADNQAYAAHWLSFWNDLLRNDYRGTGYIDGGRKQISQWLHSALATNLPYDRFVAQLIHPNSETEGFTKGILWRGAVNASQAPQMQAAQNISQVFMGVNLKCASCHDSFINDWALADSYGLASVYSDEPLELVECDKPTGRKATVHFLYPQLGDILGNQPKTNRTARLAQIMISKENGRLSRTVVNRLWARLLGRGLVEPVDDMEQLSWNPDLLDWLAEDLVSHGYNLKRTLELILTSQAYAMPAVSLSERLDPSFTFRGPAVRRLSAEQFRDALGHLTGIWHADAAAEFDLAAGADSKSLAESTVPEAARWIWSHSGAEVNAAPGDLFLRKSFTLSELPTRAIIVAIADDSYTLFVNGTRVMSGKDHARPQFADLRPHLRIGENLIAVQAANEAPKPKDKDKDKAKSEQKAATENPANPAGVLVFARLDTGSTSRDLYTDASWSCATNTPADWKLADLGASAWKPAIEIASSSSGPWNVALALTRALSTGYLHDQFRASLVPADPLTASLGRPPREQVMTVRASAATTLQALELSNGNTLSKLLKEGAQKWVSRTNSSEVLIDQIFARALNRRPNATERTAASELLARGVKADPVEDLLWAIAMLPEFQLIY